MEIRKVVWPTTPELTQTTLIVVVVVVTLVVEVVRVVVAVVLVVVVSVRVVVVGSIAPHHAVVCQPSSHSQVQLGRSPEGVPWLLQSASVQGVGVVVVVVVVAVVVVVVVVAAVAVVGAAARTVVDLGAERLRFPLGAHLLGEPKRVPQVEGHRVREAARLQRRVEAGRAAAHVVLLARERQELRVLAAPLEERDGAEDLPRGRAEEEDVRWMGLG